MDMGYARHGQNHPLTSDAQKFLAGSSGEGSACCWDLTRSAPLAKKSSAARVSIYPDELKALHLALNAPYDTLLP